MDLRRFKSSSVSFLGSCTCQREPRSVNVPLSDSMKSVNILALIKYLISRLWTPRNLLLLLRNRKKNFMKFNQFYKISVAVCAFNIGMTDWVTWLKTFFRLTIENVSFRQQSENFKNWLTMARDKKHLKKNGVLFWQQLGIIVCVNSVTIVPRCQSFSK